MPYMNLKHKISDYYATKKRTQKGNLSLVS